MKIKIILNNLKYLLLIFKYNNNLNNNKDNNSELDNEEIESEKKSNSIKSDVNNSNNI